MLEFIYYLIGINVLTFLIYGIDKWKARRGKWRIPEDTLIRGVFVVFSVFAANAICMDAVHQIAMAVEELDGADAVPAIPEPVMAFGAVRGFIVHQQHVLFLAGDIGD